jgi:hypothetical protein
VISASGADSFHEGVRDRFVNEVLFIDINFLCDDEMRESVLRIIFFQLRDPTVKPGKR